MLCYILVFCALLCWCICLSCMFQRMCVLCLRSQCASKCIFHRFCLCFRMSEVISSFRSLRAGSHVFALLILFLCVILHTMWLSKLLQLQCILPFGILCLSAIILPYFELTGHPVPVSSLGFKCPFFFHLKL